MDSDLEDQRPLLREQHRRVFRYRAVKAQPVRPAVERCFRLVPELRRQRFDLLGRDIGWVAHDQIERALQYGGERVVILRLERVEAPHRDPVDSLQVCFGKDERFARKLERVTTRIRALPRQRERDAAAPRTYICKKPAARQNLLRRLDGDLRIAARDEASRPDLDRLPVKMAGSEHVLQRLSERELIDLPRQQAVRLRRKRRVEEGIQFSARNAERFREQHVRRRLRLFPKRGQERFLNLLPVRPDVHVLSLPRLPLPFSGGAARESDPHRESRIPEKPPAARI